MSKPLIEFDGTTFPGRKGDVTICDFEENGALLSFFELI